MRNARPTQSPSRPSQPADETEAEETRTSEDANTRIQFLSWDAPLVPDPR